MQLGTGCLDKARPGLGDAQVQGVQVELARFCVAHHKRDADRVRDLVALCSAHAPAPSAEVQVQLARVAAHLLLLDDRGLRFVHSVACHRSGRSQETRDRL